MSSSNLSRYVRAVQNLNQDAVSGCWTPATNGLAPHKPLLLISVLDEFLESSDRANLVEPTVQLEHRFDSYWQHVIKPHHDTTFALPFFHLKNDGFWHLIMVPEITGVSPDNLRTSSTTLRKVIRGAKLDDGLYDLVRHAPSAQHL